MDVCVAWIRTNRDKHNIYDTGKSWLAANQDWWRCHMNLCLSMCTLVLPPPLLCVCVLHINVSLWRFIGIGPVLLGLHFAFWCAAWWKMQLKIATVLVRHSETWLALIASRSFVNQSVCEYETRISWIKLFITLSVIISINTNCKWLLLSQVDVSECVCVWSPSVCTAVKRYRFCSQLICYHIC